MAATVVSDGSITVLAEEQQLCFPSVTRERPTMGKEDRLPLTPIFVGDLGFVFGRDGAHGCSCLNSTFEHCLAGGSVGGRGQQRDRSSAGGKCSSPGD